MKYSIGEVAKMLDISPSTLRFYEKKGLLFSQKKESGWRYYNQANIVHLVSFRKYSSMGFPVKTIAEQFSPDGEDRDSIARRVKEHAQIARNKARRQLLIADVIEEHYELMQSIDTLHGKFEIAKRPSILLLYDPVDYLMTRNESLRKLINQWLEALPSLKISAVYGQHEEQAEPFFCYSIREDHAKQFGLDISSPFVKRLDEAVCIHSISAGNKIFTNLKIAFAPVLAYMKEKGLSLSGEPIAQLIVVECGDVPHSIGDDPPDLYMYMDVWAPFEILIKSLKSYCIYSHSNLYTKFCIVDNKLISSAIALFTKEE